MNKSTDKSDNFSVALGLTDYINPIFYTITSLTIMHNMKEMMTAVDYRLYVIGAVISLIGGYIIPTGKFIVGLGIVKFVMPVPLVLFVNSGILLSGLMLLKTVFAIPSVIMIIAAILVIGILIFTWKKTGKLNTSAVLTGAVGYLMIYIALIFLSIRNSILVPIFLYALAIALFITLVMTGIKANLYDARVHWFIEITNILCQGSVALATWLLFR